MEYRPSSISSHVPDQFPKIYQEDGPDFVAFVKSYYEFLDGSNNRNFSALGDIDNTIDTFLKHYKNKYLHGLPFPDSSTDDIPFIVKNIADLYRTKGTSEALELMFKLFYKENAEVFYPSSNVLTLSDSKWAFSTYIEFKPVTDISAFPVQGGDILEGDTSEATAFVDEIVFYNINGVQLPIAYISNVYGKFTSDDSIKITRNGVESFPGKLIKGSLNDVTISQANATSDNKIGDRLNVVSSKFGIQGEAVVREVSSIPTGAIDWQLKNGGWGYDTSIPLPSQSFEQVSDNRILQSTQVLVVDGAEFTVDINPGDTVSADPLTNNVVMSLDGETGSPDPRFTFKGNAAVVAYEHPLLFVVAHDAATDPDFVNPLPINNTAPYTDEGAFHVRLQSDLTQVVEFPSTIKAKILLNGESKLITALSEFNNSASFEVESFTNEETVTFFTDKIGDYANVRLGHTPIEVDDGQGNITYQEVLTERAGEILPGNLYEIVSRNGNAESHVLTINNNTDLNATTNLIEVTGHGFLTGEAVTVTLTGGTFAPFTSGTTYFVYASDQLDFSLHPALSDVTGVTPTNKITWTASERDNASATSITIANTPTDFTVEPFNASSNNHGTLFFGPSSYQSGSVASVMQGYKDTLGEYLGSGQLVNRTELSYPMSGNASHIDYRTKLANALGAKTQTLGTIDTIKVTSSGADFQNDVRTFIFNDAVRTFKYGPLEIRFDKSNFIIEQGDILEQTFDVPNLATNDAGEFVLLDSTSVTYTSKARLLRANSSNNTFVFEQLTFYPFNINGSAITFGGQQLNIESITRLEGEGIAGENALIEGKADFLQGQITDIDITKSGFRYVNGEDVSLVNNDPNNATKYGNVVGSGSADVSGPGITEGRWITTKSHLSDSNRYIHDNDYYQNYSYDVSTILDPTVYEETLKGTVHVAGTKFFGTPLITSTNNVQPAIDSSIAQHPTELRLLVASPTVNLNTLKDAALLQSINALEGRAPLLHALVMQRDPQGLIYLDISDPVVDDGVDINLDYPAFDPFIGSFNQTGNINTATSGNPAIDARIRALANLVEENAATIELSFMGSGSYSLDVFKNSGTEYLDDLDPRITDDGFMPLRFETLDSSLGPIFGDNHLTVTAGQLVIDTVYVIIDRGSEPSSSALYKELTDDPTRTMQQGDLFTAHTTGEGIASDALFIPALFASLVELPGTTIVDFNS